MPFEIFAAFLFVCSSGLIFNERFRNNKALVSTAGLLALMSTYFLLAQFVPLPANASSLADQIVTKVSSWITPTPRPDPITVNAPISVTDAKSVFDSYLAAWQRGDVDQQATFLSDDFVYSDQDKSQGRTDYLAQKRRLALRYLASGGQITISPYDVRFEIDRDGVAVHYTQRYESPVYWSVGTNTFRLRKIDGIVKITSETFRKSQSGVHS